MLGCGDDVGDDCIAVTAWVQLRRRWTRSDFAVSIVIVVEVVVVICCCELEMMDRWRMM